MSKYFRHQSVVSRQSDETISEDHWLKQFQKTLQKGAVQSKKVDSTLFEQINSIMNGKSKYPSVSAAVEEMKERSGLTAYLDKINKVSTDENNNLKTASDENDLFHKEVPVEKKQDISEPTDVPIVIKKIPQIKGTIMQIVDKGFLSVPAIINRVQEMYKSELSDPKDWEDSNLIKLVSKMNLQAKSNNVIDNSVDNSRLGIRDVGSDSDIDPSNRDAFNALNPAKMM